MAKKKKKSGKSNINKGMSPVKFMKEKARQLPLEKCYINENWQEDGLSEVIITRRRKDGDLSVGCFLVDTFCLGVKDAFYRHKFTDDDLKDLLRKLEAKFSMKEISYEEAHNLILGAVEFAEEAGIEPHKDFEITSNILEEDNDDIPLIEYEYGKDGKYLLIVGPTGIEIKYLNTLRDRLGDKFDYVAPFGDIPFDDDYDDDYYYEDGWDDDFDDLNDDELIDSPFANINWDNEEEVLKMASKTLENLKELRLKYPMEPYNYDYPHYPDTLMLNHPFIWDELKKTTNTKPLPKKTIKKILGLPSDKVAEDLSQIMLYIIGQTYSSIPEDNTQDGYADPPKLISVIWFILELMTEIKNPKCFDAILEFNRQSFNYIDFVVGDNSQIIRDALYLSDKDGVDKIMSQLNENGVDTFSREALFNYLLTRVYYNPELREETIELIRNYLKTLPEKVRNLKGADSDFVGHIVNSLLDMRLQELLPEIKRLYKDEIINPQIVTLAEVEKEINLPPDYRYDYFATDDWLIQ